MCDLADLSRTYQKAQRTLKLNKIRHLKTTASVAESVDAADSKSVTYGSGQYKFHLIGIDLQCKLSTDLS